MHWEEPEDQQSSPISRAVADVRYRIRCRALPVDHAGHLCEALCAELPWLTSEPLAGIHAIHGAESGNGWIRPDDPETLLPLSRRTRLCLRLPRKRIQDAATLTGRTLDVGPHRLAIETARVHMLTGQSTLFARYVALEGIRDEEEFLQRCAGELDSLGISAPRLMPGRAHRVETRQGTLHCHSLMVDGLSPADSVLLQERGLGAGRLCGCGLFLPHKSIAPVAETVD